MSTLTKRLATLGFHSAAMGGNCRAYIRPLTEDHYEEVYTENLDLDPTSETFFGTLGPDDDVPPDLRTFPNLEECVVFLERMSRGGWDRDLAKVTAKMEDTEVQRLRETPGVIVTDVTFDAYRDDEQRFSAIKALQKRLSLAGDDADDTDDSESRS